MKNHLLPRAAKDGSDERRGYNSLHVESRRGEPMGRPQKIYLTPRPPLRIIGEGELTTRENPGLGGEAPRSKSPTETIELRLNAKMPMPIKPGRGDPMGRPLNPLGHRGRFGEKPLQQLLLFGICGNISVTSVYSVVKTFWCDYSATKELPLYRCARAVIYWACVAAPLNWVSEAAGHHGGESDSTLVAETARQAVAPQHVKLATHIGAKPNFQPLPMVA